MSTSEENRDTTKRRNIVRDNGLLLACLALFAVFFLGMIVSGAATYNEEQREHGSAEQVSVLGYLGTSDFVEATFENWESEFLQMGMYVVLTAFLYQRGSAESKPITGAAPQDEDPRLHADDPRAPWPVRRGGLILWVYENSLVLAFFALFFTSMALHAAGGVAAFNDEQLQHGQPAMSMWRYLSTAQFWFESMQNWRKANSSPWRRSSACRSCSVSEGPQNPSRSPNPTAKPEHETYLLRS